MAHDLAAPPSRNFDIVPKKALPIVGVVLVALVAAIASNKLWAIDFFHVVGGGLWTAVDLFVGFVVGPILGRLSIPARMEFSMKFMPKMLVLMPTLVIMTLAAGWQLARHQKFILSSDEHHGCGVNDRGRRDGSYCLGDSGASEYRRAL